MKLKALAAVAVAGIMVMSVPMVAMAETDIEYPNGCTEYINDSKDTLPTGSPDGVIKVKGDVNTTGCAISVQNKNAQVEGNVRGNSSAGEGAVYSCGSSNWVHVSGEVKGSGTGRAIVAYDGTEVTVGSAENTSAEATVRASGSGTTVTIKADEATGATGAVTNNGNGTAIQADNGATVTADSAINSEAGQNGPATIQANVNSTGDNDNKTKITVDGAVTNEGNGTAIEAYRGAIVTAESATNGKSGESSNPTINASGSGTTVIIKADEATGATAAVTNNGNGYAVSVASGATVVVEGTVDSYHSSDPTANVDNNADTRLIVYEITNSKYESRKIKGDGAVSNVYYIIKGTDSAGISNVEGMTNQTVLAGTADEKTYKTAKYNDVITFSVTSGYELKEGNIKVTPNADGTYSITIPVGGGVTLEAIKKAIEQAQSSGGSVVFTPIPTSQGSSSAPITSGSWAQASEGKFTYTNNGEKLINCVAWIQYTDANGQTVTGKYCFDNNGYALVNTWKEVQSGVWNYFGVDGKMVTNTTTPDGYVVDANGEWRK